LLSFPKISQERRSLTFALIAVFSAFGLLGWQMRPPDRGTFPPPEPQVFGPAPPWASPASAAVRRPAPKSAWPKESADNTVLFVDAAKMAGLDYRWSVTGRRPLDILQTIGNGCAFLDYDGDGDLDVLLVGTDHLALFHGDGHGHFTDVSHPMGLDTLKGHFLGCAVGDYDNDGYDDVYISGYRTGLLLHNEVGKSFKDVTPAAGMKPQPWGTACTWGDIDNDGRLDLFVGNYAKFDPKTSKRLCTQKGGYTNGCGPLNYFSLTGVLYHNDGGGRFRDVTDIWHPSKFGKTLGAAFADYDQSGRPGLALANDEQYGELHQNMGNTFQEVGGKHGVALDTRLRVHGGMGMDWGDYDNDGWLDQVVATYQNEPKCIYHNTEGGFFKDESYTVGVEALTVPSVAFGVKWLDFDNSGWLGLMIANGHVDDDIARFDHSTTYRQPTQLFRNVRGKRFADLSTQAGSALQKSIVGRGLAVGDFDNDGRMDALVVDSEGPPLLLRNESSSVGHWLSLKLVGTQSNRDGIGSLVTVTTKTPAGGLTQTRLCHTDGSYLSASDVRVHIGLGQAAVAETISVKWPSGRRDTFHHVHADRFVIAREGTQLLQEIRR